MATRPRVVVGVDGSDCGNRALAWALDYVRVTGGSLTAVTAWHFTGSDPGLGMMPEMSFDPEANAREVLAETVSAAHAADRVEQVVAEGAAATVLVDLSRDADLLVVGSRGRSGVAGIVLGSTSDQCTHHAHCPVVVVRG